MYKDNFHMHAHSDDVDSSNHDPLVTPPWIRFARTEVPAARSNAYYDKTLGTKSKGPQVFPPINS